MGSCISCNTWSMISLRLTVLFLIGIEAAPKPDSHWNWNANPMDWIGWNGFPGSDANPGQFNWNGLLPSRDTSPGPWNWNGFPPSRDPWQRNWRNGSPLYSGNRGNRVNRNGGSTCPPGYTYTSKDGLFYSACFDDYGCMPGYPTQDYEDYDFCMDRHGCGHRPWSHWGATCGYYKA